jgi:hypothetical protein
MKLFFVFIVILIATKTVILWFNKTGKIKDNKNKQEITMIIVSFCSEIYSANTPHYNLYNFDFLN